MVSYCVPDGVTRNKIKQGKVVGGPNVALVTLRHCQQYHVVMYKNAI